MFSLTPDTWKPLDGIGDGLRDDLAVAPWAWRRYVGRVSREGERLGWLRLRRVSAGQQVRITALGVRALADFGKRSTGDLAASDNTQEKSRPVPVNTGWHELMAPTHLPPARCLETDDQPCTLCSTSEQGSPSELGGRLTALHRHTERVRGLNPLTRQVDAVEDHRPP